MGCFLRNLCVRCVVLILFLVICVRLLFSSFVGRLIFFSIVISFGVWLWKVCDRLIWILMCLLMLGFFFRCIRLVWFISGVGD